MLFEDVLSEAALAEAQRIANEIINFLKPKVKKIAIAGSIARKKSDVGDIDLVAVLKNSYEEIKNDLMNKEGVTNVKGGKSKISFSYKNMKIDLWFTSEESFDATRLHFSWGKGIIHAKSVAKNKGYTLNRYGLYKKNQLITSKPSEIFKIIGVTPKNDLGL